MNSKMLNNLYSHPQFQDLRCICLAAHSNKEIIVAGCQSQMFRIDIEKGQVTEVVCWSNTFE